MKPSQRRHPNTATKLHASAQWAFKGGYITRHFGQPEEGIHAIQLELSQATYLNDELAKQSEYQLDGTETAIDHTTAKRRD